MAPSTANIQHHGRPINDMTAKGTSESTLIERSMSEWFNPHWLLSVSLIPEADCSSRGATTTGNLSECNLETSANRPGASSVVVCNENRGLPMHLGIGASYSIVLRLVLDSSQKVSMIAPPIIMIPPRMVQNYFNCSKVDNQ